MRNSPEYKLALEQARERKTYYQEHPEAIGNNVIKHLESVMSAEEIAVSEIRTARLGKRLDARDKRRAFIAQFLAAIMRLLPGKAGHDGSRPLKSQ